MACLVMVHKVMVYAVMAYKVVAYLGMGYTSVLCIVPASIVIAYIALG